MFFWILKVLEDVGVICGGDMILEVVFIKLSYVFSKEIWILDKKRKVSIRYNFIFFLYVLEEEILFYYLNNIF